MRLNKALLVGTASSIALIASGSAIAQDSDANAEDTSDVIFVTGIRSSLASSLDTKRNADSIVEAITAEDIGKFPDKNVAESLQRLTGVAINREFGEGERVSIRGTDTNLSRTLLNGHAVGTADWFVLDQLEASRSFNYLMLPSEIVSSLEVYKSPQADIDEGGIGGTVIVRTLKPLDGEEFSISGSVGAAYAGLADEVSPQGSLLLNWHNRDKTFGVNVAGIWQERELRRDGIEILGYNSIMPSATNPTIPAGGLLVPDVIGSAIFRQKRERRGINGSIQWAPNDQFEINLTGLYSEMDADNFNNNYLAAPGRKGGIFNLSDIQNGAALSGSIPTGQPGFSLIYDAIAREASTHTQSYDAEIFYRPNDQWEFRVQGGYTEAMGATDRQFIWETLTSAPGIDYDLTGGAPVVSFDGLDPTDPNDPTVLAEVGWAGGGWEITNSDDEFYMFADAERELVDAGPFRSVKFGGKFTDHDRATNQINQQRRSLFSWSGPLATGCDSNGVSQTFDSAADLAAASGFTRCGLSNINMGFTPDNFLEDIAVAGTLDQYLEVDPDIILAISNDIPAVDQTTPNSTGAATPPDLVQNANVFIPGGSFDINEQTFGGYVMTDLEGPEWRGNFGVRVVHTKITADGWQPGLDAGDPGTTTDNFGIPTGEIGGFFAPISEEASYTDILPSMNFAYDVTDDIVVRIAAARTMTRPNYNQLVRSISTNPTLFTAVGGGAADLDPFRANQFDLSFEYYYAPASAFNIGFFYKDLQSVIAIAEGVERLRITPAVDNMGTPDTADDVAILNPDCTFVSGTFPNELYDCDFDVSRPRNVGGATFQGIEVAWQHTFENGFGGLVNYTYTDAEQEDGLPMPGASEHIFNVTGFYENEWLSARVSYTHRTDFFIRIDRANQLSQDDTKSLDASVTAKLNENFSVSVDAINLTDELIEQYSVERARPRAIYDNGRIVFLTLRAKF